MYTIIDVETTGLRPTDDKITEIAIYKHDGEQVVDSFHSLVNPECYISDRITQITGITNEMVADAPKFYEIAKDIIAITEGTVFVAHNAHFDYSFVREEFKALGYKFTRKTLCTVRVSRKVFPGLQSYSLAKLCKHFKIQLTNHHRASADALATVEIFEKLLAKNSSKITKNVVETEIKAKNLPPKINLDEYEALPEDTGVYYFHNEDGDIIYIGKSINIKKRVGSHFTQNLNNRKSIDIKSQVAGISYELTGSELVALLLESDEIKRHHPKFNRAQRRIRYFWGIYTRNHRNGYLGLYAARLETKPNKTPLTMCGSGHTAREILYSKVREFKLCMKLCGLYQTKTSCFDYQIKQCEGACIGEEAAEDYNARVEDAIATFNRYSLRTFLVLGKGRNKDEQSIVAIERGRYLGFGYVDKDIAINSFEEAKQHVKTYKDNLDVQKIIYGYLKQNKWSGVMEEKANEDQA
jgi:DNA polymerase-3 subunit epsilon